MAEAPGTQDAQEIKDQPPPSLARTLGKQALDEVRGKRSIERLPGVHLNMKPGHQVFLRLACVDQRYEATFVGAERFAYFIVNLRLPQDTLAKLQQNSNAIAQVNTGEALFGFRTEVLNRISVPAPLLFLSHPDTVERLTLRRGKRLKISLSGSIHGPFGQHDVLLLDMAPEGCRFTARAPLKSPLREAQPGDRIALTCTLGDSCSLPLVAPVILRRVDEGKGRVTMGGQFVELSEDNAKLLNDYLMRIQLLVDE